MSTDPSTLVTVLMPVRNANPRFLRESIDSVFSQSSPNWNLIIIYDPDDAGFHTLEPIHELKMKTHDRVLIVANGSQRITGALNTGMKKAITAYVCTLLGDDLLAPDAIETLNRAILSNPSIDFFYSSRRLIDENGKAKSDIFRARPFSISDFREYGPVKHLHCWKVMSALKIGGMDESLGPHGADDYDFPWSMAEAGFSFKTIPECLYLYRQHSDYRLTTHVPLNVQIEELRKILRKHGMSEKDIEDQIKKRRKGYLKEALYKSAPGEKNKSTWITRLWKSEKA